VLRGERRVLRGERRGGVLHGAVVCSRRTGVAIDAGVQCNGMHPLVRTTEPMRYCAPGNCYCGDPTAVPIIDACYAAAIADACCPVATVCY
jgi:hypothetical protein